MSNEQLMNAISDQKLSPISNIKSLLEKNKSQIANALPAHLNADRMIRLACTEFSKNPSLLSCDQKSLFGAIIQSAQLGLEIGVLGQSYILPFKNGKTGKMECQFIPGYKGLINLARRSGEITSIETHIVYENDEFNMTLGIDTSIIHKPFLEGDRGKPIIVYGVAKFKDGGYQFEWMTINEVNKIRARSKSASSSYSPWNTDYEQMVRKTLIRRMSNYLPMSIEFQNAVQILDATEQGKNAIIEDGIVITTEESSSENKDEMKEFLENKKEK